MSDDQKAYLELEMLQELGLLEEGANIMTMMPTKEVEIEEPTQELENHMVIGEYYENE